MAMAAAKTSVLSSLAVYGEDSEPESDSEAGGAGSERGAEEKGGSGEGGLRKTEGEEDEEDDGVRGQPGFAEPEKREPQERARNVSPGEVKIPPEPPGRCSRHLQAKIQKLYERKREEGTDVNFLIQRKKQFRNPRIHEKLIQFCAVDELGTNYPKDRFDPHGWSEDSYYEALARAQETEMDRLEEAKKERTKMELVTGTKKGTTAGGDAPKRKSKWDSATPVTTTAQPTLLTATAALPAVVTVTTTASGSKTTLISAVGTIVKKAKQ